MSSNGARVVVLGGGVGGIVTANELRHLLPDKHRVIVIEKEPVHAFAPSFLWVMNGDRTSGDVKRPLSSLLRTGIDLHFGAAKHLDIARKTVETSVGPIEYDFLVIALGAVLAPEAIPGLAESAHSFYTLAGAERLAEALKTCPSGMVAVVVASLPYKCPGAPLEGAMLIADTLKSTGRRDVQVALYTPEPQPMPVAGPQLGQAAVEMLESRGIKYYSGHRLQYVDPAKRHLVFDGSRSVSYSLLVAIPPHKSPEVVAKSALAANTGWISVDHATLQTNVERVYAIGDVTAIPLPGRWKPDVPLMLPKAGVFAHSHGLVVARRIAHEILGTASHETFCGDGYCMLEAGEDLAGFAYGNFFAEPSPQVNLHRIGRAWHIGKVLFEKMWLSPPGLRRRLYAGMIEAGARMYGVPTEME
jgi:sulfide:quinone oxidoreductase